MKLKKVLASFAVVSVVRGCAAINAPSKVSNDTQDELLLAKAKRDYQDQAPNVHAFAAMYVPVLSAEEASLPKWYDDKKSMSVDGLSLEDVVANLIKNRNIRVEWRAGVIRSEELTISGKYNSIGGYLEAIAAATGYQVDTSKDSIVFSKFVERVFPIRSIAGKYEYAIGKRNENIKDSTGDGNEYARSDAVKSKGEEYGTVSGSFNPLHDFRDGVEVILGCSEEAGSLQQSNSLQGGATEVLENDLSYQLELRQRCEKGAKVKILTSDNSLLVRALPSQMNKVARFIAEKTERELRQVRVDVTLVAVEVHQDTALSLELNLDDSQIGGSKFGASTTSNASGSIMGGLGSLGSALVSHQSGTQVALKALQEQGTILDKTILRGVIQNNRITKITDVKKQSFIAKRELAQTADVGTATSIEQEVVQSGRVLYVQSNIGPSDVVLHISSSLSQLLDLDTKGEDSNQVESPEISDRELNAVFTVQPGKPLMVGGFTVKETQSSESENGLSGISRSSRDSEVELVMVVEAVYI